ncbi:OmpA family protein [Aquimarina sp. 2201CG14-23]|uniref:OmpA family protein n=1 Tax=Aquimarina mycalae TaxID=3040073 RepID=UPI002477D83B|nr:OmpA family protein [Aquimarina sp. 2201CG14-23]MDH7447834.1 OmpA family protein [Aquimarina sp. 2201CG14-23]
MKIVTYTSHFISGIILILPFLLFSQEKSLKKANKNYENLAYIDAIDSYRDIINKGNGSIEVYQKLADAYYYNSDLENAGKWYGRMIEHRIELIEDSTVVEELQPEYYYRAAQCYKHMELYDQANELIAYVNNLDVKDSRLKKLTENPNYLEDIVKQSGRYEIINYENNSAFTDFAPSIYKDQLIFSSSRGKSKGTAKRNPWNEQSYLGLFKEVSNDSLALSFTKEFAKELSSRLHESTSVFTMDGTTIYFTRNNIYKGKSKNDSTGINRLKIYKAVQGAKQKWSQPEELPFNNDQYSVAHPTLSFDGKKLYFASDMPGGYGASDLYVVNINDDGSFGTPQNLGPEINTEGRDTFPFISKTGMLYFASDGHPGLGGLDIFVINTATPKKKIYNIGRPVNSNFDDVTFIIDDDTKKGYFASNRSGGRGDDDLYSITELKPLVTDCAGSINGVVLDKKTNELLIDTEITVNNQDNEVVYTGVTDMIGAFTLRVDCDHKNYTIQAKKKNYTPITTTILTSRDSTEVHKEFFLENDAPDTGIDLAKLLNLKPIYFASSKALILGKTAAELDKIATYMKEYPTLKIEIGSHTDSKGSDAYNLKLSSKRATATANYIISKGIDPDRVKSRGYGETLLQNKCSNGVRCSKEQHQQNRRSEFIVTEN